MTPADSRPYIDATSNNNPFSLVFGYNGLSRFSDDATAFGAVPATAASRMTGNTGWGMLFNHTVGPQIAWFLPLAVLAVVTALIWRAREPRTDPLRAGFLLWGGWLVIHAVVFSVPTAITSTTRPCSHRRSPRWPEAGSRSFGPLTRRAAGDGCGCRRRSC
ncbi:hypothetical protein [Streptomyces viridochromogenes]|uniref:hypothetical protein n=1 Tax=Streptomyces viridochromogenes TaxID=1938 RepID=UPI000AFB0926|nr:hypothetical protein [Streptomyces viridochromogenes]